MEEAPATRASLLLRIRDEHDHGAWQEFLRLYGPVVYRTPANGGCRRRRRRPGAGPFARSPSDRPLGLRSHRAFRVGSSPSPETRSSASWRAQPRYRQRRPDANEPPEPQASPSADGAEIWDREYERQLFASRRRADQERVCRLDLAGVLADSPWTEKPERGRAAQHRRGGVCFKSRVLSRLREMVKQYQEVE